MANVYEDLEKKSTLVRKWCAIATTQASSGHLTSALSAAEIGVTLFEKFLRFDIQDPGNPSNDRFILSKGHASPLLYTLFAVAGGLPLEDLKSLRKLGSTLEGHPNPRFPYTPVATGSLGQGLSVGAGMSFAIAQDKALSQKPKVYVLLGDGEMAEGSNWEAANFASHYGLNNLIAIIDVNRLGQSQETMLGYHIEEYVQRFSAFGWEVIAIDGHNFQDLEKAFTQALNNMSNKPFVIVAKTTKGKGISFLEDKEGWHGKALNKEELEKALLELGEVEDNLRFNLKSPNVILNEVKNHERSFANAQDDIKYKKGEEIATREVYGKVLSYLADNNSLIYSLDADVKNSTFSESFKKEHPDRFIECFIAEQNMVGVAMGLWVMGKTPFVSTFASFLTRAFDQIRMATISGASIRFVGSHAGVSIGEDGPSQMGLEDIAMFGAMPNSLIFHPSDAVSTSKLLPLMVHHKGISYLRTLRPKTPVIYSGKEEFIIGGSKTLRESKEDVVTVVAAGITVHEALKAYEMLKTQGIAIRVIDCYSVKPIDKETLIKSLKETKKPIIITVEDHFEHGGLGDFVLDAVSTTGAHITKLAVDHISYSGTKDELLDDAGIDSAHIVKRVKTLI